MAVRKALTACFLFMGLFLAAQPGYGGWGDVIQSATQGMGKPGVVPEEKAAAALKEALRVGTGNAVALVSQPGGFYRNPSIRIGLPESIGRFEEVIRMAGYGAELDAFELSMNEAAEKAAPLAKDIFWDAVGNTRFDDAQRILNGREDEATRYFREKTYDRLYATFKPVVGESMAQAGVADSFQALHAKIATIPFVGGLTPDLNDYVTRGALDGLFHMVAQEEKKIRQNPAARVTDLLKEVFGR